MTRCPGLPSAHDCPRGHDRLFIGSSDRLLCCCVPIHLQPPTADSPSFLGPSPSRCPAEADRPQAVRRQASLPTPGRVGDAATVRAAGQGVGRSIRPEAITESRNRLRETGFLEALEVAKGIALDMDIGTTFRKKREIKRKRQFDENPDDTNASTQSPEESFRISYFLSIVDQAISSLTTRFEQYQGYQKNFGFLFTSDELQSLDNQSLKSSCENLEAALSKDGKSDIDANDLYVELKFLQDFIPKENMDPVEILKFLKHHDCFPKCNYPI
ncbi:uncharacterized protein LOC120656263 [Panicum virgatum]|uniref:Uncharacterized protein n=1 Tax=Panicum virgatum TaxID=38727 RepID=A0A8T0X3R3_PANVG|nr:uncharacterized protein LOC120656263 [Panicum virgatum]KAG2651953.1 hypothetical protein PVAP13_1NG324500 [Panicum virgatum]KAG2651954.1 hypothetical protein PVAP13_1NG324500 [Panicum virgatum]